MARQVTTANAESQNQIQFFPSRFQVIHLTIDRKEVARDPAGALVFPTGHVKLNTAAVEGIQAQLQKYFPDVSKCGFLWAADENTGEIAGCCVGPTVKGVTAIRVYKDGLFGGTLRGLFREKGALRPETRKWVSVTFQQEEGQYPYFILHLNIALPQSKARRRKLTEAEKAARQAKKDAEQRAAQEKAEQKAKAGPAAANAKD